MLSMLEESFSVDRLRPYLTKCNNRVLDAVALHVYNTARRKLNITTSRVVSELSFGFWTMLCDGKYENAIWRPGIVRAFRNYKVIYGKNIPRKTAAQKLFFAREFRNRIAHHEPVHYRALLSDYESILEIGSWLAPNLDKWIEYHSRCRQVIPNRVRY